MYRLFIAHLPPFGSSWYRLGLKYRQNIAKRLRKDITSDVAARPIIKRGGALPNRSDNWSCQSEKPGTPLKNSKKRPSKPFDDCSPIAFKDRIEVHFLILANPGDVSIARAP
ncbi:hypothetical protein Tco_0861175 [Tanacetum coccineum]|uniref:Uncharacterized protein n=1 Tax=Tanacetum coccineum TaxID=301880 RepID=A0ABQ5BKR7_9ASTR